MVLDKQKTILALLRGVNVGGKNQASMKEVISLFKSCQCTNVTSYIQSGNIIFNTEATDLNELTLVLSVAIKEKLALNVPIVLRTHEQLQNIVQANPFVQTHPQTQAANSDAETAEEHLHVLCLDQIPMESRIAQLDKRRSLPDTFAIGVQEIYLNLPNGMGRTKLSNAYFDSKLKVTSTGRNWRTIKKLLTLMNER